MPLDGRRKGHAFAPTFSERRHAGNSNIVIPSAGNGALSADFVLMFDAVLGTLLETVVIAAAQICFNCEEMGCSTEGVPAEVCFVGELIVVCFCACFCCCACWTFVVPTGVEDFAFCGVCCGWPLFLVRFLCAIVCVLVPKGKRPNTFPNTKH